MVDNNEAIPAAKENVVGEPSLFDIDDGTQVEPQASQEAAPKDNTELSGWRYDEKIRGEGQLPEWFNHKTFKNVAEQARAYNEARKQITEYSEKLKSFSGAPEKYEENETTKNEIFAIGLKELGQKIGLNQEGFNELIEVYKKTKEIEAESQHNNFLENKKEELKKIGGTTKLRELETKFLDRFGETSIDWLKGAIKSYEDYTNFERIMSDISSKTRLPINSVESAISTREQAEGLIRDPRWGKDKEFTNKVDKLLGTMLQGK